MEIVGMIELVAEVFSMALSDYRAFFNIRLS